MASFLSSLFSMFSGKGAPAGGAAAAEPIHYNGCRIYAEPMPEGGQFRLAGRIEKDVDGRTLVRNIIRADMFSSRDDAVTFTLRKAEQIIDQTGTTLFSDGETSRSA